ncbi:hypothetical protein SCHPADRAFT_996881 [Schizopora paradoxa]|uniref:Uncharacterized protein n=1 Tax=Schizopora paradoxa TaxID=27342 RepID=A0A0H2SB17_9AGAM|nr:hypothetical protein SCHPADRAFT_996881 [Schizopora paradoxa]
MDSDRREHDALDSTHLQVKENEVETKFVNSREDAKLLIDKTVIDFMEGLMDRVRNSSGRSLEDLVDSQADWHTATIPSSPCQAPLSHDISRSESDSDELRRAYEMRTILEPSSVVLRALSNLFNRQLEDCSERITAIRAGAVLSSFPVEILSSILEMGAYCSPGYTSGIAKADWIIESVNAAVRISSVCSRFRHIAIHTPSMWNRICVGMPEEMLKTCVDRAGSLGLDIFFDISIMGHSTPEPREELALPFLEFIVTVAGSWRQFDHHCFTHLSAGNSLPVDEMSELEVMTSGLYAPRLSEPAVRYGEGDGDDFDEGNHWSLDNSRWHKIFHYYSTWTVPALQSMSTFNLIPIPFSGCSSIGILYIDMDYTNSRSMPRAPRRSFDANGVSAFLSSCTVLRKFTLRLTQATLSPDAPPISHPQSTTIKEFHLYLDQCGGDAIERFINAIRCPNTDRLALTVICGKVGGLRVFHHQTDIVSGIFSNPEVFPHLEHLHFSALSEQPGFLDQYIDSVGLPIERIPNLKSLALRLHHVRPVGFGQMIPAQLSSILLEEPSPGSRDWVSDVWYLAQEQGRAIQVFVSEFDGATPYRIY